MSLSLALIQKQKSSGKIEQDTNSRSSPSIEQLVTREVNVSEPKCVSSVWKVEQVGRETASSELMVSNYKAKY